MQEQFGNYDIDTSYRKVKNIRDVNGIRSNIVNVKKFRIGEGEVNINIPGDTKFFHQNNNLCIAVSDNFDINTNFYIDEDGFLCISGDKEDLFSYDVENGEVVNLELPIIRSGFKLKIDNYERFQGKPEKLASDYIDFSTVSTVKSNDRVKELTRNMLTDEGFAHIGTFDTDFSTGTHFLISTASINNYKNIDVAVHIGQSDSNKYGSGFSTVPDAYVLFDNGSYFKLERTESSTDVGLIINYDEFYVKHANYEFESNYLYEKMVNEFCYVVVTYGKKVETNPLNYSINKNDIFNPNIKHRQLNYNIKKIDTRFGFTDKNRMELELTTGNIDILNAQGNSEYIPDLQSIDSTPVNADVFALTTLHAANNHLKSNQYTLENLNDFDLFSQFKSGDSLVDKQSVGVCKSYNAAVAEFGSSPLVVKNPSSASWYDVDDDVDHIIMKSSSSVFKHAIPVGNNLKYTVSFDKLENLASTCNYLIGRKLDAAVYSASLKITTPIRNAAANLGIVINNDKIILIDNDDYLANQTDQVLGVVITPPTNRNDIVPFNIVPTASKYNVELSDNITDNLVFFKQLRRKVYELVYSSEGIDGVSNDGALEYIDPGVFNTLHILYYTPKNPDDTAEYAQFNKYRNVDSLPDLDTYTDKNFYIDEVELIGGHSNV